MSLNDAPDHVKLAVDMICQMENLQFAEETVLEACLLVIQDTLNKLSGEDQLLWRQRLSGMLTTPLTTTNQFSRENT